jgi:hypothetical protein
MPLIRDPRRGPAPSGYVRIGQEWAAADYAEALTQLTGRQAVTRLLPNGRARIRRALRRQLCLGKPVIVATRAARGEILPCGLVAAHAYEVLAVRWRAAVLRSPWGFAHPRPIPLNGFAALTEPCYATLA